MDLPEYVTKDEVRRVCAALKIRDWAALTAPDVKVDEAATILAEVNTAGLAVSAADFRQALEVELEHGTQYADANVTNNHPVLTGKIVLAHLKESLDYYKRLEVAEVEGDVLKAVVGKNLAKLETLHRKLAEAKLELAEVVAKQLA